MSTRWKYRWLEIADAVVLIGGAGASSLYWIASKLHDGLSPGPIPLNELSGLPTREAVAAVLVYVSFGLAIAVLVAVAVAVPGYLYLGMRGLWRLVKSRSTH